MSHGGKLPKTCHFGHTFEVWEDGGNDDAKEDIRNGSIDDWEDLKDEYNSFAAILERWKYLKFRSSDQGTAYTGMWVAVDELTTNMDYDVTKVDESIHVSPQSQLHAQFMERKQQAENNIKQTMQSYQQLYKQKHMLQHDIRKLRSRVEAINSKDEVLLKGDFIELVDGAGQSPRQGGDQMSLKAYRDQNIYPSIVADFNEMESVEDLETAEQRAKRYDDKDEDDLEDGPLADIPTNEKAVLKKKWKMYEKWKDLYGSEVERKLNDLKGQMKNIERSIEETEEWLEPYVKDAVMINRMGDDQSAMSSNLNIRGNSTMFRELEFVVTKPMVLEEGEMMIADSEEEATHYRAMIIKCVHANIAGFSQPQSPADGPSAGIVMWYPFFCCRHVYEDLIEPKIKEYENMVDNMMDDYTGDFETDDGNTLKDARNKEEMSVRELREKIEEKFDEDENVPIQLSADIRRVEDGLDSAEDAIEGKYLKKIDEILDTDLHPDNQEGDDPDKDMYKGFNKKLREFTGKTDEFKIPSNIDPMYDFTAELRRNYYWGLKLDFGMYTMK